MTVLEALEVEEGTQWVEGPSLVGARGLVACVEAVAVGSCCRPVVDRMVASWVVGMWREEAVGQEEVLKVVDRRDTLGVRSWVAWSRRDPQSSSWTEDSGSLHQTYRSSLWTSSSWKVVVEEGGGEAEEAGVEVEPVGEEELFHFLVLLLREELGEAALWVVEAWGSPVEESLIQLVLEPLVHLWGMHVSV